MFRRISMPVRIELDATGRPRAFTWRGVRRRVEVIGYWHLSDRWWVSPALADLTGKGASDRHYYRLLTRDNQVFEVYRDLTSRVYGCSTSYRIDHNQELARARRSEQLS